ncbi:hypothetical protein GCM10022631_29500 [Deinococcus rubellus]|uniref:Uncharacterized protein n=1 Tax=Deinococcus rubellus TaxID=1889240 RepID=A0ABY5YGL7_9DEIO|nr:hypothetical protein [Deinococcus rubellus]UWX64203.1 hypothetical protein N0D28_00545 [Deinococcus rubellus]
MSDERYWLTTPTGRRPLPRTLAPDSLAPTARTRTLVRAYGYLDVLDLSDGLPDPVPIILKGLVHAASEAELSRRLDQMAADARSATLLDREHRNPTALIGGSLVASAYKSNTRFALVTLTLTPAKVPDPASLSPDFF